MLKKLFHIVLLSVALVFPLSQARSKEPDSHSSVPSVTTAEALSRLTAGNARFVAGKLEHPHQNVERRTELAAGQQPYAIILACSDSRTPPELLFDQGLGDLFIVRVAGNVVNDEGLASIEYAVDHLGARLIVVLGHERCGAVTAAREAIAAKTQAPAHFDSLVAALRPAVEATATANLEAAIKANVENVVKTLKTSEPVLKAMVAKKDVVVKGAYYDLDTGAVTLLDAK
jgi:carbonic anhydrase